MLKKKRCRLRKGKQDAGAAWERGVALLLSVTKPLPSYDSNAQENNHFIILVISKQCSPSSCFPDIPEGGVSSPLPIIFT